MLDAAVARAVPTGDRTHRGQALWEDPQTRIRLVTKHDAKLRQPVVVTVLEPGEAYDEDLQEEAIRFGQSEFAREEAEREADAAPEALTPVEPRRGLTVVSLPAAETRTPAAQRLVGARVEWARRQKKLDARRSAQAAHIKKFDAGEAKRAKAGLPLRHAERARQVAAAEAAVREQIESNERWLVDYLRPVMSKEQALEIARGGVWPNGKEQK